MRCLVVADLHYSLPQFDWLLSAAPHFDLVIFAGDALDVGSLVDFRAQIVVVRKYLTLLSGITKVILCSGNHDLDERSAEGEKISRWIGEVRELGIACDGDGLTIGDTLFTVCPWWDGPLVKQRLEDQLHEASAKRAGRRALHRPEGAARSAGPADRAAAGLAHILGSDCRSEPGETSDGGRLIMLCRRSPTIARWLPWPAYCCLRSAR